MDYTVISEADLPTFKDKVRQKLEDGWEFNGSIVVVPIESQTLGRTSLTVMYVREMIWRRNVERD